MQGESVSKDSHFHSCGFWRTQKQHVVLIRRMHFAYSLATVFLAHRGTLAAHSCVGSLEKTASCCTVSHPGVMNVEENILQSTPKWQALSTGSSMPPKIFEQWPSFSLEKVPKHQFCLQMRDWGSPKRMNKELVTSRIQDQAVQRFLQETKLVRLSVVTWKRLLTPFIPSVVVT